MILNSHKLGSNLRRIRKECKMTQPDVIAQMQVLGSGLSVSAYSKIEHGIRNVKASDLVGLQQIFSVDYADIFRGITPGEDER